MALDTSVEKLDRDSAIVTVRGPLSLGTNLKIVDTHLQQLVEEGVTRLVLDLAACPYCDSAGLGVLIHTSGLVRARGGSMRLCGVPDRIGALLKLTHTETVLPCDSDSATSIAALS